MMQKRISGKMQGDLFLNSKEKCTLIVIKWYLGLDLTKYNIINSKLVIQKGVILLYLDLAVIDFILLIKKARQLQ